MFREADDDEADLDWNFVDRFSDQGREEEGRKLDLEVPTHKASEVEEWVRDRGCNQNSDERILLQPSHHNRLHFVHNSRFPLILLSFFDLVEYCSALFGPLASHRCGSGNEVRRQLSDGSASTPEECLQNHLFIQLEESDGSLLWNRRGTWGEVIELPTAWNILGHRLTLVGSEDDLCNMRSEIEHEGVQTRPKADWAGDSQTEPIQRVQREISCCRSIELVRSWQVKERCNCHGGHA